MNQYFEFAPVNEESVPLIHQWLAQDYINEWLHGQGLENTFKNLDEFIQGKTDCSHWIAFDNGVPFGYLIVSPITLDSNDAYGQYCSGEAITLDVFIGNPSYIGKGIAHVMIQQFLLNQFPTIQEVIIDPEAGNQRAIRVYEKVGFKIVGERIAPWHPVPHFVMRLNMEELRNNYQF